jgi:protein subunit release factor B
MKLFKVSNNYHRGIKEVEVLCDNGNGTFDIIKEIGSHKKVITKPFISDYSNHSSFFKTYEDAKDYIIDKINVNIEKHKSIIDKDMNTLIKYL